MKINYNEFINKFDGYWYLNPDNKPKLSVSWIVGGQSGGSCWGDEPTPISGDSEPPMKELDAILKEVAPTISYLDYRKLATLIKEGDGESDWEYYGNYTDRRVKTLYAKDLYDFLKSMGYIQD